MHAKVFKQLMQFDGFNSRLPVALMSGFHDASRPWTEASPALFLTVIWSACMESGDSRWLSHDIADLKLVDDQILGVDIELQLRLSIFPFGTRCRHSR